MEKSESHRAAISAAIQNHWSRNPHMRAIVAEKTRAAWVKRKLDKPPRYMTKADATRQSRYGVTPEQFAAMWQAQGGCCAICKRTLRRGIGKHNVDHCHRTLAVRGLLCSPCNAHVGWFELHAETAPADDIFIKPP